MSLRTVVVYNAEGLCALELCAPCSAYDKAGEGVKCSTTALRRLSGNQPVPCRPCRSVSPGAARNHQGSFPCGIREGGCDA